MPRRFLFFIIALFIVGLAACRPEIIISSENPVQNSTKTPIVGIEQTKLPLATPTTIPCSETTGTIQQEVVVSVQIYDPIALNIYLPPCYGADPAIRFPVLYMLHGQGYRNDQWVHLGISKAADELISNELIQPMIIVMPFEEDWHPGPMESAFDEALISDIIPYVDTHYQVCTERSCRAVGGLSRGGNWAVYLGFAHPEMFTAVGAHSAPLFFGEPARIEAGRLKSTSADDFPSFFIDVGRSDPEKEKVLEFVEMLDDLDVNYEFFQLEGRHDEEYWGAHVEEYLSFYSSQFERIFKTD